MTLFLKRRNGLCCSGIEAAAASVAGEGQHASQPRLLASDQFALRQPECLAARTRAAPQPHRGAEDFVRKRGPHLCCLEAIATNNVEWDPLVLRFCVMLGVLECLDLPPSSPPPLNDMGWAGGAARFGCEGTSKFASRSAISKCRLNRARQDATGDKKGEPHGLQSGCGMHRSISAAREVLSFCACAFASRAYASPEKYTSSACYHGAHFCQYPLRGTGCTLQTIQ